MSSENYSSNEIEPIDVLRNNVQEGFDKIMQSDLDFSVVKLNPSSTENELTEAFKINCEQKLRGYCAVLEALRQSQDDVIIDHSIQKQIEFLITTSQFIIQVETDIYNILSDISKNFREQIDITTILQEYNLSYLT